MPRVSVESNIPLTTSTTDMIKELWRMKKVLDEKGAELSPRKLEVNKDAYVKMVQALNALDVFLNCEVIISTQYQFAKMWGWTL